MTEETLAQRQQDGPASSPAGWVKWALSRAVRPMVTTSFGVRSAAMLHLVCSLRRDVPVVWIDTGFNTPETYRHAEHLVASLGLDLRVYAPDLTPARIAAVMGGVPEVSDRARHAAFSYEVKIRPFERALEELRPDVWLTGIRRTQTAHRRRLQAVTRDPRGLLKVAPFFELDDAAIDAYLERHALPSGDPDYADPVKALAHRECGLHRRRRTARPQAADPA